MNGYCSALWWWNLSTRETRQSAKETQPLPKRKTAITEKDIAITEKNRAAAERDMAARERDRAVTERDGLRDQMTCLVNSVSFRAGRIITFVPRTVRDALKRLRKSFR